MSKLREKLDELECTLSDEEAAHQDTLRMLEVANTNLAAIEAQLPDGMKHCTIVFEQCPVGHGSLRAINWLKKDCPWCRIKELERDVEAATGGSKAFYVTEREFKALAESLGFQGIVSPGLVFNRATKIIEELVRNGGSGAG